MSRRNLYRFLALLAGLFALLPLAASARNTEPGIYTITVYNETKGGSATNQAANAGDILQFHLIYHNTTGSLQTIALQADLQDLLYLGNLIDLGGGALSGYQLTYPSLQIANANQTEKIFRAQVKSVPPATIDLLMSVVFGTVGIDIKITPGGIVKGTYTSPSTGTSSNLALMLAGLLTLFVLIRSTLRRFRTT